jgi:hypothetical protein
MYAKEKPVYLDQISGLGYTSIPGSCADKSMALHQWMPIAGT